MNQSPKCRAAFIAAMEAQGITDRMEWEITEAGTSWDWLHEGTADNYFGFCLNYREPSDVDAESLLGKLKEGIANGYGDVIYMVAGMTAYTVPIAGVIDLIETLQQTALNGSECSQCLAKPATPECMYCAECYSKLVAECDEYKREAGSLTAGVEQAEARVRELEAELDAIRARQYGKT